MANVQLGYGHTDAVGVPFDFYAGANLVASQAITMQTCLLVLAPTGALSGIAVTLPLNPPDGAVAEITSTQSLTSFSVSANTGDSILNGVPGAPTAITPAGATSFGSANPTLRYRYSLNGSQAGNAAAINTRTWIRVQ